MAGHMHMSVYQVKTCKLHARVHNTNYVPSLNTGPTFNTSRESNSIPTSFFEQYLFLSMTHESDAQDGHQALLWGMFP